MCNEKWLRIEGFLQKCWKFHFAVSFLFLNRFLCFLMFFKVQNRVFPFFASGYGINLLQWTKKWWLSAVRSQKSWKIMIFRKFRFVFFDFFDIFLWFFFKVSKSSESGICVSCTQLWYKSATICQKPWLLAVRMENLEK